MLLQFGDQLALASGRRRPEAFSGVEHRDMASDKTADKTVTPERIIAAAIAVALREALAPRRARGA